MLRALAVARRTKSFIGTDRSCVTVTSSLAFSRNRRPLPPSYLANVHEQSAAKLTDNKATNDAIGAWTNSGKRYSLDYDSVP